jgi:hypothetical protein
VTRSKKVTPVKKKDLIDWVCENYTGVVNVRKRGGGTYQRWYVDGKPVSRKQYDSSPKPKSPSLLSRVKQAGATALVKAAGGYKKLRRAYEKAAMKIVDIGIKTGIAGDDELIFDRNEEFVRKQLQKQFDFVDDTIGIRADLAAQAAMWAISQARKAIAKRRAKGTAPAANEATLDPVEGLKIYLDLLETTLAEMDASKTLDLIKQIPR